jgi:hypothetical protein
MPLVVKMVTVVTTIVIAPTITKYYLYNKYIFVYSKIIYIYIYIYNIDFAKNYSFKILKIIYISYAYDLYTNCIKFIYDI